MNPLERSSFMVIKSIPIVEIRDGRPHMSSLKETTVISESCYVMDSCGKWYIEVLMGENGTINVRAHGAESLIISPYSNVESAASQKEKKGVAFKEGSAPKIMSPPTLKRHEPPALSSKEMEIASSTSSPRLEIAISDDVYDRSSSSSASVTKKKATLLKSDFEAELLELAVKGSDVKGTRPNFKALPKLKDDPTSSTPDASQVTKSSSSLPFDLSAFSEALRNSDGFKEGVGVHKGCLTYLSPDDKLLYMHFTKNKDGNNQMNFNLGNTRRRNSVEFAEAGWEPYYSDSVLKSSIKDSAHRIFAEFMTFIAESC